MLDSMGFNLPKGEEADTHPDHGLTSAIPEIRYMHSMVLGALSQENETQDQAIAEAIYELLATRTEMIFHCADQFIMMGNHRRCGLSGILGDTPQEIWSNVAAIMFASLLSERITSKERMVNNFGRDGESALLLAASLIRRNETANDSANTLLDAFPLPSRNNNGENDS